MVRAFGHRLGVSLAHMHLSPGVTSHIQSNLVKLGGLELPANLDDNTVRTLRTGIAQAFVFGFRLIMLICAALAVASAWTALRMIPRRAVAEPEK